MIGSADTSRSSHEIAKDVGVSFGSPRLASRRQDDCKPLFRQGAAPISFGKAEAICGGKFRAHERGTGLPARPRQSRLAPGRAFATGCGAGLAARLRRLVCDRSRLRAQHGWRIGNLIFFTAISRRLALRAAPLTLAAAGIFLSQA